jgi:RNA polymerase sigma factor (sigma-70 family)
MAIYDISDAKRSPYLTEVRPAPIAEQPSASSSLVQVRVDDFTSMVKPHISFLVRLASKRMGSRDLAWEAVQETLFTLWKSGTRPEQIRPWLAQTVIHRCLHMQRTARRRRYYEELSSLFQKTHHGRISGDRGEETERSFLRRIVSKALDALPEKQRVVLWLREVDSLDYRSIAERQHISEGTVRSRLHRARAAMRRALENLLDREHCELCKATTGRSAAPENHRSGGFAALPRQYSYSEKNS